MEKNIKKIAVIGAESTGKTSLCSELATWYHTVYVEEYARDYFKNKLIQDCTLNDIEAIAKAQIVSQKKGLEHALNFLFCDTNLITLKIWAELEFNSRIDFIEEEIKKEIFDLVLITNNDVPWTEDVLRENKFSREMIFELNEYYCKKYHQKYKIVSPFNFEEIIKLLNNS